MKLLDLYSGAGGAAVGYHRAGFDEIVGVDIAPQPRYLFAFVQMDALEALRILLAGGYIVDTAGHRWYLSDFDVIHSSPPCQAYSVCKNLKTARRDYSDLVSPTRSALIETGKPYIIENVEGAPLENPLMLCGSMFGLGVLRHRLFECNPPVWFPPHPCDHRGGALPMWWKSRVRALAEGKTFRYYTVVGNSFLVPEASRAMGIDWMTRKGLSQAIPPAFTEYIGRHLVEIIHG